MGNSEESPVNILLVDDRPENLLALEAVLVDLGENLVRANGGEEALAAARDHDFAVILLDVQMPGVNGFDAAKRIREMDRSRTTPIIFISAYDNDPSFPLEEAYGLGAVDYLVKPLVPAILKSKVSVFVELYRSKEQVRRHGERLRARAESTLKLIFESVRDFAIVSVDRDGRLSSWNAGAENVFGYLDEEIIGEDFSILFTPEDRASQVPEKELATALATGRAADERWHIRKDGTRLFASGVVTPLKDESGAVIGFTKVARDVTRRVKAENSLRRSEARKAAILESALDCIITIDHEDRIIEFNPAAERTFGYRREEVIGRAMVELIVPERYREQHLRGMARFLETSEGPVLGKRIEVAGMRSDGSEFPAELAITVIRNGENPTFTAYLRDISERKEAEESLKEADRRKDEFLAMLAHELRNPLASVNAAVRLLQLKGPDDPDLVWGREVIARQVKHLARLLDDLLDVSRISRGRIELRRETFDVSRALDHALETVKPLIEERRHQLDVSLNKAGALYVNADPVRLEQVVVNLLSNAAKYTENGGHVQFSATNDGEHVVITVKDDGVGIPPEKLPKMFELFAQGDRSLARSEGGLGIGLTLVKLLTEMHGGSVTAKSDGSGKGSEFTVRFPAIAKSLVQPGQSPEGSRSVSEGRRVLIIDDNADTATGLARLLKILGHEVQIAYNGLEGIEAARSYQPDVILLDIGLPGMDGYEVARTLRQEAEFKTTLIVAITGYGQDEDRRKSQEAGFDHHFVKPLDHNALITILSTVH